MKVHPKHCGCAHCVNDRREELARRVLDNIKRSGFHMTALIGTGAQPPFIYTAGLETTLRHPELVIYGLDPGIGANLFRAAVDLIRAGTVFDVGQLFDGIVKDFRIACHGVPESLSLERFHMSYQAQPAKTLRFVQLIWPDEVGRFPWDALFDQRYISLQPVLEKLV